MRKNVANTITILSFIAATIGLTITLKTDNLSWFFIFIIISAILDSLDGAVARKLSIQSELGIQLDSLVDVIVFGLYPALIISITLAPTSNWFFIPFIFTICGIIRLARFNIQKDKSNFIGLPIPISAIMLTLANLLFNGIILMLIMLILSYLMISPIKIKKPTR